MEELQEFATSFSFRFYHVVQNTKFNEHEISFIKVRRSKPRKVRNISYDKERKKMHIFLAHVCRIGANDSFHCHQAQ